MGTGLLKPNISGIVGSLYPIQEQAKRDAGFSIFYMGINIGATISPLITGYLGENVNWHYGFAAAGIGMVLGLVQYKLTEKHLGDAGLTPTRTGDAAAQARSEKRIRTGLWIGGALLALFITLLFTRTIVINPVGFAEASRYFIAGAVVLYFIYVFVFEKMEPAEKKKIAAIGIFFIASTMFYAGYEQQGSSLNLFAERYTDMFIGTFEMPASWMQAVPAGAVVIFVPVFAWLWVWLANRKSNPSTPVKVSFGLIFMGLGYAVMMGASLVVVNGEKPLPTWLTLTYVLHTFGEICLYPIGLSAVTKLSPQRLVGQMMGIWFMSLALGNLMAGLFAGEFDANAITANPSLLVDLFGSVMKIMLISGLVMLIISKPVRKLMGDIR
jgi:POT family proton-dependent oligopeptide transporter